MFKMYNTDLITNITEEVTEYKRGNWINMIAPSDDEIKTVCENINIQEDFIRYALDPEERARIDYEEDDGTTLILADVPIIEKDEDQKEYSTIPVGFIIVRDEYFITVSLMENQVIRRMNPMKNKSVATYKKSRLVLQCLYVNSEIYLNLLKKINRETEIAEKELRQTRKNKSLLRLLSLEKSLVYFTTSLKANEVVMERMNRGKVIKLYEEDEDLLEDVLIENKQAMEMSKIYSDILSGVMDAYSSIISNNLNGVMKILTAITIIISVPTMISSFWGMNVKVPMQDNPWGFAIILIASILIGIIVTIILKRKDYLN
ncbi:MAG: magnesium transporter CorA family protein [Clostridia bacterium]|nr:magnesium transporter CorA family protein [Clostridia bacterium]CDE83509.1 mg2 transporter protein CorA family protein [Clostridium sp. CAG:273]